MARPKSGKYDIEEMCQRINSYTDACIKKRLVPILKEVVVLSGWNYDYVQQLQVKTKGDGDLRLSQCISRLVDTKEYSLEKYALQGRIDKTMAVFSLKQLGWRDQQAIDVSSSVPEGLKITLKVAE